MSDRVALLRKGRIAQAGRAFDLYRAPKDILAPRTFSDLNEVPASIKRATPRRCSAVSLPMMGDGKDAILCVRQRGVGLQRAKASRHACSTRCYERRLTAGLRVQRLASPCALLPLLPGQGAP